MGGRRQFSGWLNSEHEEELLRVTVNSEGEELNLSERDADYLDSSSEMSEWKEDPEGPEMEKACMSTQTDN